jgi:hypothetical protein
MPKNKKHRMDQRSLSRAIRVATLTHLPPVAPAIAPGLSHMHLRLLQL